MKPVIDLPPFPENLGEKRVLDHARVKVQTWDGNHSNGKLFEFNGPGRKVVFSKPDGGFGKVDFDAIRLVSFVDTMEPGREMDHNDDARLEFTDGSIWEGHVHYYLNDHHGLHFLAPTRTGPHRFFVPWSSVKDYRFGPLLGEILIRECGLTREDINKAVDVQRRNRASGPEDVVPRLGEILVEQGKLSADQLQDALARQLGIDFVRVKDIEPAPEVLALIPEYVAREHQLLPIALHDRSLKVAMVDASNAESVHMISFLTGLTPEPVMVDAEELRHAMDRLYAPDVGVVESSDETEKPDAASDQVAQEARRRASEKPIVRLVNDILSQAINRGTSDIHIRPEESIVQLLFRIDGTMQLIREFKKNILAAVVSRIKIMGGMDISERRVPQDGQIRVVEGEAVIDMRVSIIPTVDGESIVIRILNTKYGPLTIEQLGFTPAQQSIFEAELKKAHGLILVTGPTGSGKSTTLYAALDVLKQRNLSIITIENPVEFHIPGIDQVQVNETAGLTFARVLRNILRHDPEAIMVGEIRDQETAKIAVQSSLTGHLVLSTLHTNSAIGSISRLLDMGLEPYVLAPTLLMVVAQRLLKKNCKHCMVEEDIEPLWRPQFGLDKSETFYRGAGCDECNGMGLSGRVGVYEVLAASQRIASAIVSGVEEHEIEKMAIEEGMTTLTENALQLARAGTISLSQVYEISSD